MFTPVQYRAKATEYARLVKTANSTDEVREFQALERSFTALADNEQWLTDNQARTVHRGDGEASSTAESSSYCSAQTR